MTGFLRPTSLTEALAYLDKTRATVAAGCTDLFPATGRRDLAGPILDVTAIEGMRGITKVPGGSSSKSALGFRHIARAVASICCSPPDRVCARWRYRSRSRGNSVSTSSSTSGPLPRAIRPISRFCATVSPANNRRPCGI